MNTQVYNEQVNAAIQSKINNLQKRLDDTTAKFLQNISGQLSWLGEDLFNIDFMLKTYRELRNDIHIGHEPESAMYHHIAQAEQYVSHSFNVRENSTGAFHRECSTLRYIATMEFIKELKAIDKSARAATSK